MVNIVVGNTTVVVLGKSGFEVVLSVVVEESAVVDSVVVPIAVVLSVVVESVVPPVVLSVVKSVVMVIVDTPVRKIKCDVVHLFDTIT